MVVLAPNNPFRPAPGSPPPALVGRDFEQQASAYALEQVRAGAPWSPILITGMRGMGKTVLLRHTVGYAMDHDMVVLSGEAAKSESLTTTLAVAIDRAVRRNATLPRQLLSGFDAVRRKLPRVAFGLPNDMGEVSLLGDDRPGTSEQTLYGQLVELNELAARHDRRLVIALDEIQDAPLESLRDVVAFIHETAATATPAFFLGAGLPSMNAHLAAAKTYTERWQTFRLDLLPEPLAELAIGRPFVERGVNVEPGALRLLAEASGGYPYFIQEYGAAAWALHESDTLSEADAHRAIVVARSRLDASFYGERLRALTPRELDYVIALADLGPGAHNAHEVPRVLGLPPTGLSSTRNQLVAKEVLYSPAHGLIQFRLPLADRYVREKRSELVRRAQALRPSRGTSTP